MGPSVSTLLLLLLFKGVVVTGSIPPEKRFVTLRNAEKTFAAGRPGGGVHDATPDPLVGWGGDIPCPILTPSTPS